MNASRFLASRSVRLAFAFILVLVASQFQTASVAHDDAEVADVAIFRTDDFGYVGLLKLDPSTLADDSAASEMGIDPDIMGLSVIFSRDGHTLAGVTEDWEVIIQRGLEGPVVSRFPLGEQGWLVRLSADGSRLLASVGDYEPTWKVFDTATGKDIASFEFTWDRFGPWIFEIDPVSWKMYRVVRGEWNRHPVSPWLNRERLLKNGIYDYPMPGPQATWMRPPALVAIDLLTGEEIDRLELPPDVTNAWLDEADASRDMLVRDVSPALALSPDGSELALVNATDDGITLFDTGTLTVKRSLAMTPKTSLVDELFLMLPLAPQTASAKVQTGVWRNAEYSSDGIQLYVSGWEADVENVEQMYQGMGWSIIDLEDGTIEAQLFEGAEVFDWVETRDGTMYVVGRDFPPNGSPSEPFIARFDPDSQEILAKRSFVTLVIFLFAPGTLESPIV